MGITILGQDVWNNPSQVVDGLYYDTRFENNITVTSAAQYLLTLFGGYAGPNANMSPDVPGTPVFRQFDPSTSRTFTVLQSPAVTIDNAPTGIALGQNLPTAGTGRLFVGWNDQPIIYGALLALSLQGVDLVTARANPGIVTTSGQANSTGTSASQSHTTGNPNNGLFSIMAVKGAPAIAIDANQVVLSNQLSNDGNCRIVFTYRTGADPLTCSFSWTGSQYWALTTVVVAAGLGGNQIAVMG